MTTKRLRQGERETHNLMLWELETLTYESDRQQRMTLTYDTNYARLESIARQERFT